MIKKWYSLLDNFEYLPMIVCVDKSGNCIEGYYKEVDFFLKEIGPWLRDDKIFEDEPKLKRYFESGKFTPITESDVFLLML